MFDGKMHNYLGAIHIHTKFSDGTGDINAISRAAKKAGLDWIIITDHNNFEIEEGIYNGICVIKGEEISPKFSNHYLALGIKNCIPSNENTQLIIDEVRKQKGFGFAAHPHESQSRNNNAKPIRWTNEEIIPDGIEIWNWFSDWADGYNDRNIFTIAYSYLFKHRLISGPSFETLRWWDNLNKNSKDIVPAIVGVDAHALQISKYIVPVEVFSYSTCFKTLTNVTSLPFKMPDDFEQQKSIILSSLKNGNNIMINRHLKNEIPFINVTDNKLMVKLSTKALVKIIQNGTEISTKITKELIFKVQPNNKYRIEIYLNNSPWLFTNPIIIK